MIAFASSASVSGSGAEYSGKFVLFATAISPIYHTDMNVCLVQGRMVLIQLVTVDYLTWVLLFCRIGLIDWEKIGC